MASTWTCSQILEHFLKRLHHRIHLFLYDLFNKKLPLTQVADSAILYNRTRGMIWEILVGEVGRLSLGV